MSKPQSFENHTRIIPLYHGVAFSILLANFVWHAWRLFQDGFSGDRLMQLLVGVALVLLFFFARVFALTAQDRVIRNEMRQRLTSALPPELAARARSLTLDQLVALRFASDAELPSLCETVLRDNIRDRKTIKRMIKDWQADDVRV